MATAKRNTIMARDLERLEVGGLSVEEARTVLAKLASDRTAASAAASYASLRSWTGRLLRGAASGDDLRGWHNLINAVAAQFRRTEGDFTARIGVLAELIHERVGMAETRRAEDVLGRQHVRALLRELAGANPARVARAELGSRLRLEQANLTRVCTMLLDAGLVLRRQEGRSVSFELTAEGAAAISGETTDRGTVAVSDAGSAGSIWATSDEIAVADNPANQRLDAFGRHDHDEFQLAA